MLYYFVVPNWNSEVCFRFYITLTDVPDHVCNSKKNIRHMTHIQVMDFFILGVCLNFFSNNKAFIFPCVCAWVPYSIYSSSPGIMGQWQGTLTTSPIKTGPSSLKDVPDTAQLWYSTVYSFSLHRKTVYPFLKVWLLFNLCCYIEHDWTIVCQYVQLINETSSLGPSLLHYVSCFGRSLRAYNRPCHPSLPRFHSSPQCHQAPKVEFLGGRKPIPKERGVDVAGAIESVH